MDLLFPRSHVLRLWQSMFGSGLLISLLYSQAVVYAQDRLTSSEVVERYRQARTATMQAEATEANVSAVAALLADSVVYEHPRAGARLVGRAAITEGIRDFRGKTRRARVEVLHQIAGPDAVAAEERVTFETDRDGVWSEVSRTQLSVYEVRNGQISRLIEYWQPH
jgi:ketosteroid isomerase-like protein